MRSILLIIQREFFSRIQKKSFIISTLLAPILFAGSIIFYVWILSAEETKKQTVNVLDKSGYIGENIKDSDIFSFKLLPDTISINSLKESYVKSGSTYIVMHLSDDSDGFTNIEFYSDQQITPDLRTYVNNAVYNIVQNNRLKSYNIEGLDLILKNIQPNINIRTIRWDEEGKTSETNTHILTAASTILSLVIYMFIFMFGSMVMRGVIEEKSNRIIELIISSVRPFQLMMGKILGVALVGLFQFVLWILLSLVFVLAFVFFSGTSVTENNEVLTGISDNLNFGTIIFFFFAYFIGGYLLYASMFAAIGSAVETEADTQQLMLPITLPLIFGMMIMARTFQYPDGDLSFWASIIPFTSPLVMMARLPFGVPVWQLLLSLGLLVISFVFFVYASAKIYRIGIFMYGKKSTWKDLWTWFKQS